MKFERGRKKNQLIWSFILKVIASQTSVKVLFYLKTQKGKRFWENTFRSRGNVRGVLRHHLTRESGRAGH